MIIWFFQLILISFGFFTISYKNTELVTNIYISIFSLLLLLILIESYFRFFNPQKFKIDEHTTLFEHNSIYGWDLIPNKSALVVLPREHETTVLINSLGMRDQEYSIIKPEKVKRIIVIGDSFTSGFGVRDNEVFTEVMESSLLSNVEVLNFGVNGFGPTQELLMLQQKCFKFDPDVVIMLIYIRNDFDDIIGTFDWIYTYQRPKALLNNNGRLTFENIPIPPPKKLKEIKIGGRNLFEAYSLHLIEFIRNRLKSRIQDKSDVAQMPPEIRLCKKQHSDEMKKAFNLMEAILKEASSFCRDIGVEFVVIIAPTIVQINETQYWEEIKELYDINDKIYDLYLPNKELKRMCESNGISIFDLTPALKLYAESGNELYYRINQHWNSLGHNIVATEIVKYLHDYNSQASDDSLNF